MAQSSNRQLLLLCAVAACMFFVGLGRLPLTEPDEGRNAEKAREMLDSGDWITPHYDTLTCLDKPALFFWLVAASFRVFGLSEWAARFPSALMALATSLLVWFLARRMSDNRTGLRAGLIWATSPLVIIFARNVIFDMPLTFFVTLAMASYWLAEAEDFKHPWRDAIFFAAMGIAAITKGPVGFLLPLLSVSAYLALRGRLRELRKLRWGLGVPVFLASALPWFVAVSVRNPDFPKYALWQESLLRFATGHARRPGGPLYYLPVFLAGFLPWSFFLLLAGWNRLTRLLKDDVAPTFGPASAGLKPSATTRASAQQHADNRFHRVLQQPLKAWRQLRQEDHKPRLFLLAWSAVVFVFFSISRSKLP